jgi:hypothetical protein
MEWSIEFGDGPFQVVVTASGDATAEGFMAFTEEFLTDPRWRSGMTILFDVSDVGTAGLTTDDMKRVAANAQRRFVTTGPGYTAVVAGSAAAFGLARMFQAYRGEEQGRHIQVVTTIDEAREWLAAELARKEQA